MYSLPATKNSSLARAAIPWTIWKHPIAISMTAANPVTPEDSIPFVE